MTNREFVKAQDKLLDKLIEVEQYKLENMTHIPEIHQSQGAVRILRYLKSEAYQENFLGKKEEPKEE